MLRHKFTLICAFCFGPLTVAAQPNRPASDSGATTTIGGTMRSIRSWNIRISDRMR